MAQPKISKVLIANRGEIALRIQRACKKLGLKSVSVVSEADKSALFALRADELAILGASPAAQSYLNVERLLQVAKETGCDALHPGYGFLSENADFARRVIEAGLIFVGPSPESIALLGSKTAARAQVQKSSVPITPGSIAGLDDKGIVDAADKIGYPVIIKAVAGGGGRGMRVARSAKELATELPRARAEGLKNFASDQVYIEKFIEQPRHIEVQVLGDQFGNIFHFGTRDCSAQRRHQKLVEEAPAPNLSDSTREALHQAAINAARSANYFSAGTVEFLVKDELVFFLEMNTRIQVEHPVSEEVYGVDLVALQFLVAQGEKLKLKQSELRACGHAIEFRINAEDPGQHFAPATGPIETLHCPSEKYLREERGLGVGDRITPFYDGLISKLIVSGETREQAIERSRQILRDFTLSGIPTTRDFHRWLLEQPEFLNSTMDIGFIEREFSADLLSDFLAADKQDPLYRVPLAGAEVIERLKYRSRKFDIEYEIEVTHRADRIFSAAALGPNRERSARGNWRASNGRETAVRSLIDEVLEVVAPHELFG